MQESQNTFLFHDINLMKDDVQFQGDNVPPIKMFFLSKQGEFNLWPKFCISIATFDMFH